MVGVAAGITLTKIERITADNTGLLEQVLPHVFDDPSDPDRLAAFLAQGNHFLAVAVEGGQVAAQIRAMVQHQPDAPPVLYIDNLGVAEAYQRQGIGRRLVERALAWGAGMGCDAAWVATELDNHPALALYRAYETEMMEPVAYCQLCLTVKP